MSSHGHSGEGLTRLPRNALTSKQNGNCNAKLGGLPDWTPGRSWPAWQGSPMAFIGQVNLADIAAHDEAGYLPHSGLISFFFSVDWTAAGVMQSLDDPSSWMVAYFDGDLTTLVQ